MNPPKDGRTVQVTPAVENGISETLKKDTAVIRISTPQASNRLPPVASSPSSSTMETVSESIKDEHIANLRESIIKMNQTISSQNSEVDKIRKMNQTLLVNAQTAQLRAEKYKAAAIKMKAKIKRLQLELETEKKSTHEQMGFAVGQTTSLLERLFVADKRRKDLELRFGSLARPSTKLRVELHASFTNSKQQSSKQHQMHGNIPHGVIVAPEHLHDGSFTPVKPSARHHTAHLTFLSHHKKEPSPRHLQLKKVNVPQKFAAEIACERSLLTEEEKILLQQLMELKEQKSGDGRMQQLGIGSSSRSDARSSSRSNQQQKNVHITSLNACSSRRDDDSSIMDGGWDDEQMSSAVR